MLYSRSPWASFAAPPCTSSSPAPRCSSTVAASTPVGLNETSSVWSGPDSRVSTLQARVRTTATATTVPRNMRIRKCRRSWKVYERRQYEVQEIWKWPSGRYLATAPAETTAPATAVAIEPSSVEAKAYTEIGIAPPVVGVAVIRIRSVIAVGRVPSIGGVAIAGVSRLTGISRLATTITAVARPRRTEFTRLDVMESRLRPFRGERDRLLDA